MKAKQLLIFVLVLSILVVFSACRASSSGTAEDGGKQEPAVGESGDKSEPVEGNINYTKWEPYNNKTVIL